MEFTSDAILFQHLEIVNVTGDIEDLDVAHVALGGFAWRV